MENIHPLLRNISIKQEQTACQRSDDIFEEFIADDEQFRSDKSDENYVDALLDNESENNNPIHVPPLKHRCVVCSKEFSVNYLRAHVKTHDMERQHKCNIDGCIRYGTAIGSRSNRCSKRFYERWMLNKHIIGVHKSQPQKLPKAKKKWTQHTDSQISFSSEKDMSFPASAEMMSKSNAKYTCFECGNHFISIAKLNDHLRLVYVLRRFLTPHSKPKLILSAEHPWISFRI